MLCGYRLECQTANREYFVRSDNTPLLHWPTIDLVPDIGRRVDAARRTGLQPVHMIAVAVRDHDGRRSEVVDAVQPVRSAIDHHSTASVSNKRSRVPAMAPAPDLVDAAHPQDHSQGSLSAVSRCEWWPPHRARSSRSEAIRSVVGGPLTLIACWRAVPARCRDAFADVLFLPPT